MPKSHKASSSDEEDYQLPEEELDGDEIGDSRALKPLKRSLEYFDTQTQEVVLHAGRLLTVVLASSHLFPRSNDRNVILELVTDMSVSELQYQKSA